MDRIVLRSLLYFVLACSPIAAIGTFRQPGSFPAWIEGHPYADESMPTMPLLFTVIAVAGFAASPRQPVEVVGIPAKVQFHSKPRTPNEGKVTCNEP
jgi:hypothetical protein